MMTTLLMVPGVELIVPNVGTGCCIPDTSFSPNMPLFGFGSELKFPVFVPRFEIAGVPELPNLVAAKPDF